MEEIWKDIKGFEGLYQISNLGRVKSLNYKRTKIEKIIKLRIDKCCYVRTTLSKNNKMKNYLVHRLVAEAFIPNPNNYPCINHKDENKTNNLVDNLEWCDYSYNCNYGTRKERIKQTKKDNGVFEANGKLVIERCSIPILQIDKNTNEVITKWKSASEAEREGGYLQSEISRCCNGKAKTHKGYIWSFIR